MQSIPKSPRNVHNRSACGRNYLASPPERYRAVNAGNMLLAIIAGLNAIKWPVNGFGGRNFILTIYALANGRDRVFASSEQVAALLGKANQPVRSQKSLITKHHQGVQRLVAELGREPISIDPGRRVGEGTRYDVRALTIFALAVMAKYDVLKAQARQRPQGKVKNSARLELVKQSATSAIFALPPKAKTAFNPSSAILASVDSALIYLPTPRGFAPTAGSIPAQDQTLPLPLPPQKSATHLGNQIRLPHRLFARKTESDEFELFRAQKVRKAIELAERGEKVLSIWWPKAVGVCACGTSTCKGSRIAKHPVGMKNGVSDASSDIDWIREQFSRYPLAGIAVQTTDRLVADIDFRTNGHYSLRSLVREYEPFPVTFTVRTGGGRQYHFEKPYLPIRSSTSKVAPGIDIKTGNSYVVVWGTHWTGREYRVENDAPRAMLPLWFLNLLIDPADLPAREPGNRVAVGGRNQFLFMEGLRLMRSGFATERDIYSELAGIYQTECEHGPPEVLPDEIARIAASAFRIGGSVRKERVA